MLSRDDAANRLEELERRLGKSSLYYLCKHVLGYKLLEDTPHMDVAAFAQVTVFRKPKESWGGQGIILDQEPRGSFKTTIISQALPILAILNNPNIRILLDSAVEQNSVDNLKVIAEHLSTNQKIR